MSTEKKQQLTLTEEAQRRVRECWGLDTASTFHLLKQSKNHTYLIQEDQRKHILRLTPHSHRPRWKIQAELEYILLLSEICEEAHGKNEFRLCRPIPLVATPCEYI